ncbi:hypothetical protein SLEP1_g42389 [Rubroshorea leprosula]|uniref:Uncharacterized protein n=1 Tax=Rubroshorea leprosula TaxID=152421 RepID=A0AAV5L9M9_9ROSI|nr:hypothetical protein SLEP1_g42389 [Rubroshorea leprosula]
MVKNLKAKDHLVDLDETFINLRKNKMRLNPAKCIFGVESGKFLGFMVSRKGIEVNSEKIKAIELMGPPKSVKDVQRLTGRVAALYRFISKSTDKCLPFVKIMRSVIQKDEFGKQKKFKWIPECQVLVDELKSYLSSPSLLMKTVDGKILYLYLKISDETVSSMSAIRAQALADFVAECTSGQSSLDPKPDMWILYVDGASNNKGSGARVVLVGLDGYQSEHTLKFNFDATNNMAEYKALLPGALASMRVESQSETNLQ